MIPPRKVKFEATKKEDENIRFRSYLKCNADEEKLDRQFSELHKQLFENYDCSRCRNCCKSYHAEFMLGEVQAAAEFLKMNKKQSIQSYLKAHDTEEKYLSKNSPCDFFQKDGSCMLEACKPDSCEKYPYTDQPERLHSLLGMLNVITVCPVAFEIWEELKRLYHWKG